MAEKTYKKYDSQDRYQIAGARLTADPVVNEGIHGKMVRLSAVSTSRNEKHSDLWLEINVGDFHAEACAHLKKNDVLHLISGKPCLRMYGDDNEKFSFVINRAEVIIPLALQKELKDERGWVPGESGSKANGKATDKKKTTAKPAAKPAAKKVVPVEIPDDPEDEADPNADIEE